MGRFVESCFDFIFVVSICEMLCRFFLVVYGRCCFFGGFHIFL